MENNFSRRFPDMVSTLRRHPQAYARIRGQDEYPSISGNVRFYQMQYSVLVVAQIMGLPDRNTPCDGPIYAFHIHEGGACENSLCHGERCPQGNDPFADAGMHFNPYGCPHPYHAGDLPPLFGVNGMAFAAFLTDRFTVEEIIGRTVIIHGDVDDFMTQPSGNAGEKLACGLIVRNR